VKKNFFEKLNELRKDAPTTPATIHAIICLLMGMKFVRIKVLNYNIQVPKYIEYFPRSHENKKMVFGKSLP
jgi:hypothetical protein